MIIDQDVVKTANLKKHNIPVITAASHDLQIDNCIVKVMPSMNFDNFRKEHITYPETLIDELRLEVYVKEDGLIVSGELWLEVYVKEDGLNVSRV